MTRWLSTSPPGQPPAGSPALTPASGGKGAPLRTCHVATNCATRDDLIGALAPFVEGNALFIPGRIPLEPGDVVKLNLSVRDGPVVFSGTFEARAVYREGTGVMGKAGVLFLVRRLDEASVAVHQQLLRRKRELAAGPRPTNLTRTLFGRPAELPTPGGLAKTPGPQSLTPGPVVHTPAPVLVTPQTPKPGSLPAPAANPFAEMTTNAIDFFVEATLTEDSVGGSNAAAGPGGEPTSRDAAARLPGPARPRCPQDHGADVAGGHRWLALRPRRRRRRDRLPPPRRSRCRPRNRPAALRRRWPRPLPRVSATAATMYLAAPAAGGGEPGRAPRRFRDACVDGGGAGGGDVCPAAPRRFDAGFADCGEVCPVASRRFDAAPVAAHRFDAVAVAPGHHAGGCPAAGRGLAPLRSSRLPLSRGSRPPRPRPRSRCRLRSRRSWRNCPTRKSRPCFRRSSAAG